MAVVSHSNPPLPWSRWWLQRNMPSSHGIFPVEKLPDGDTRFRTAVLVAVQPRFKGSGFKLSGGRQGLGFRV